MYFIKYRDGNGLTWLETNDSWRAIRECYDSLLDQGMTIVGYRLS